MGCIFLTPSQKWYQAATNIFYTVNIATSLWSKQHVTLFCFFCLVSEYLFLFFNLNALNWITLSVLMLVRSTHSTHHMCQLLFQTGLLAQTDSWRFSQSSQLSQASAFRQSDSPVWLSWMWVNLAWHLEADEKVDTTVLLCSAKTVSNGVNAWGNIPSTHQRMCFSCFSAA